MGCNHQGTPSPVHYKGKEAMEHVVETQAEGKFTSLETHGTEMPGHLSAAFDAARETSLLFLLLSFLLFKSSLSPHEQINILLCLAAGWLIWKIGRSAWIGWQRLERLHRMIADERWEIEHHREQERDELYALYSAKGFEGKLLDDVVDVLMADGDRLLRVMVEEELNLTLENQEHPLKQALGAGIGVLIAIIFILSLFPIFPPYGMAISSLLIIGISGSGSAYYQKNRRIPAFVWNVGLALLGWTTLYSLWEWSTR